MIEKLMEVLYSDDMNCNGCNHFTNKKCAHENSTENTTDKIFLVENKYITEADIDDVYICENFDDEIKK